MNANNLFQKLSQEALTRSTDERKDNKGCVREHVTALGHWDSVTLGPLGRNVE